jgi:uncharacterized repeat protein (TIGR01451 family)
LIALCAVAVIAASTVAVAGALISGSSGSIIRLSAPPPSVALNARENATSAEAFDEAQGVTLASAVNVDGVNPGSFTTFPNGSAKIPAGTVVDSHLIHSDPPSRNATARRTGSITFASDILGIIASTARLAASDNLGAPGTTYAGTTQWRGLEGSSENGFSGTADKVTISSDRRTVSIDVRTYVMDEIRVLTKHTNTLATTVTGSPNPVQAGDNVTYTISVKNNGSSTANAVQVADQFPGATLVSASVGCTGTTTVTCSLGSIAPGATATATVVVKTSTSGTLVNTATSPPGQDPAGTASTTVVSPSLTTSTEDAPDHVTVGNDVQYTLTVKNTGISPVADAHVVDTLPPGTSLVSATAPGGCSGTGPVDCSLGLLNVGASADAVLVVTVPGSVPAGGTITNHAVASPGSNTADEEVTTIETEQDGVSKGFVSPGGSLTIDGDNPATLSLPNTGDGAPVEITQADGTFCDGPCEGPATTISEFGGYDDPNHPIHLTLDYTFPDSPTSLFDAATAFGSQIYKNDDPLHPNTGTVVPLCNVQGAGVAVPHPCVDGRNIVQTSPNTFVVSFEILYVSGDPKFARR